MKKCAICKRSFPAAKFCYGGKQNNSYCRQCNDEYNEEYERRIKAGLPGRGTAAALRKRKRGNR